MTMWGGGDADELRTERDRLAAENTELRDNLTLISRAASELSERETILKDALYRISDIAEEALTKCSSSAPSDGSSSGS